MIYYIVNTLRAFATTFFQLKWLTQVKNFIHNKIVRYCLFMAEAVSKVKLL